MGHLSNPSAPLLHLLKRSLALPAQDVPGLPLVRGCTPPTTQRQRRLDAAEQEDLVARYQAGDLMTELAERYSIHRRTVSAILKRHGVPTRASGLSPEQIQQAVLMYAQGQSVAKIGKLLGADATTVHTRLREQGVRMRDTQGRER
jgi:DNA invertase Pin-like site-specific DNA recombinase